MPQFDAPINTNDQSLDRVLATPLPVLLLLAPGLPSAAMQTLLNDVARSEAGNLLIAKINTAENRGAAQRFNMNGSPTLIAWKAGSEQLRLDSPTPDEVREVAAFVLGRGPAPKREQPQQANESLHGQEAKPITVDESTFDTQVLRSAEPVLVDFWAPWCGPCRMIAPTLEKLAREYSGKLRTAKLNVDENPRLAMQYNASSIPLLVVFKGGKAVQRIVGAHPEPSLRKFVEQALR